jgi:hypothetical protein
VTIGEFVIRYYGKILTEQAIEDLMGVVKEEVGNAVSHSGASVHDVGEIQGGGRKD